MSIADRLDEARSGDRVPPNDLLAEQSALGGMMLSVDACFDVLGMLSGGQFYYPKHELIFDAIRAVVAEGQPADAITVGDHLRSVGDLRRAGGAEYLHTLTSITPTAANAGYYAQIVRDKATMRNLVAAGTRIVQMGYASEGEPSDLVAAALEELSMSAGSGGRSLRFVRDVLPDLIDKLESRETFVPTPWHSVSAAIGGFRPGAVYVIAARPGEGKSMLALQVAQALAAHGLVSFSSLEMSDTELVARLVSDRLSINVGKIKDNKLGPLDWNHIKLRQGELNNIGIVIDDATQVNAIDVRAHAARVAREGKLSGIVVDYLQLMTSSSRIDRHLQVAEFSRQLKILAKDFNVPVIALSQLNRESEKRAGRKPQLSDLRESGAIEQDADVVMLLHRRPSTDCADLSHQEHRTRSDNVRVAVDELVVDVAKNRHGRTGECHMRWEGEFSRVVDWGVE